VGKEETTQISFFGTLILKELFSVYQNMIMKFLF